MCNRYSIYRTDIEPRGFDVIEMDGFITSEVVERTRHVLTDAAYREHMAERNFDLGRRFFSYRALQHQLLAILTSFHGADADTGDPFGDLSPPGALGGDRPANSEGWRRNRWPT